MADVSEHTVCLREYVCAWYKFRAREKLEEGLVSRNGNHYWPRRLRCLTHACAHAHRQTLAAHRFVSARKWEATAREQRSTRDKRGWKKRSRARKVVYRKAESWFNRLVWRWVKANCAQVLFFRGLKKTLNRSQNYYFVLLILQSKNARYPVIEKIENVWTVLCLVRHLVYFPCKRIWQICQYFLSLEKKSLQKFFLFFKNIVMYDSSSISVA